MPEPTTVCVVGGANVDIEGRPSLVLRPRDSNVGSVRRTLGGVGRNIAENLARLDISTTLITALGRDDAGRWIHQATSAAGVDLTDALWVEDLPTATYLSVLETAGELHVAINDMAVLDRLDDAAIAARRGALSAASAVVVDANLTPAALARLFECVEGTAVFADSVSVAKARRLAPHLHQLNLIKPNAAEATLLTGVEVDSLDTARRAAERLVTAGVANAIISLGRHGLIHMGADGADRVVAPLDTDVVSVTGAGDALMAGLVHAHLAGASLDRALRFASAAASIAARSPTTVSPEMSVASVTSLLDRITE